MYPQAPNRRQATALVSWPSRARQRPRGDKSRPVVLLSGGSGRLDLAAFEQRVEQVRENISFDGSLFALIYKGAAQGSWQSFSAATQADEVMAPASAESEHRGGGVLRFPAPGDE